MLGELINVGANLIGKAISGDDDKGGDKPEKSDGLGSIVEKLDGKPDAKSKEKKTEILDLAAKLLGEAGKPELAKQVATSKQEESSDTSGNVGGNEAQIIKTLIGLLMNKVGGGSNVAKPPGGLSSNLGNNQNGLLNTNPARNLSINLDSNMRDGLNVAFGNNKPDNSMLGNTSVTGLQPHSANFQMNPTNNNGSTGSIFNKGDLKVKSYTHTKGTINPDGTGALQQTKVEPNKITRTRLW